VAKSTGAMGPLIGALFNSVTPPKQDKKRAGRSKGEASVTSPAQQHGELASFKEPKPLTDKQVIKNEAKYQKKRATEDWVAGRIDTKAHRAVHDRANHVLKGGHPHEFKGKTGERMPPKGKGIIY
jgi:hypothetical protein